MVSADQYIEPPQQGCGKRTIRLFRLSWRPVYCVYGEDGVYGPFTDNKRIRLFRLLFIIVRGRAATVRLRP